MAKVKRDLLFLKNTGVLIGEIHDETDRESLNLEKFVVKSVEFDTELGEYWYGDHDTGEIRSRVEKPVVTESYVKYDTNLTIVGEYPVHKQLNIIVDMLNKSSVEKTPEFLAMKEFIDTVRSNYQEQVAAYANNPEGYTWISEEEELEMLDKKRRFE